MTTFTSNNEAKKAAGTLFTSSRPNLLIKQKIKMGKTLLEKQRLFLSLVETMSLYKYSENKKDKVFYARTFVSATDIMLSLHEQGVKEETHPVFKLAMEQYRYWAKPINELI